MVIHAPPPPRAYTCMQDGNTALMRAAFKGRTEVVRALMANDAIVNVANKVGLVCIAESNTA